MKKLVEYINEALEKVNLLKPGAKNAQEAISLIDAIRDYLKGLKEQFSLTNKQDAIKLFNGFKKDRPITVLMNKYRDILSKFDIDTPDKFVKFLYNNGETLLDKDGKYKWEGQVTNILQFNPTKLESDYKEWLKSKDRVEGHKYDDEDFDPDTLERTIVVYDRKDGRNPETTLEYPFKGMRGKQTDHQVNMIRVDWCYKCGFKLKDKYFDAYVKLKDNYEKDGPAKYDEPFEFDDI